MATYVNYYCKGPLEFYSDEHEMLPKPKPPPKPLEVEQDSTGAHMIQKYYTKRLLPIYVKDVQDARAHDDSKDWALQEDHDPSHGTKTPYNVAYELKWSNWIHLLIHPAQSPDLNPAEGCWLRLKQRTKKCLQRDG
ncbi:hypothetical protein K458DRAFT_453907, partial [Lentithecium fluviatile CBS 122367]